MKKEVNILAVAGVALLVVLLVVAAVILTRDNTLQPKETEAPTVPETTVLVTEPTTVPTTEEPTEPVPTCVNAEVQVSNAPAILTLLNRGTTVDVVGEYDEDHYVVKTDAGYGLVEKQLLRMSGEAAYKVWSGYAHGSAPVYAHYQLTGKAVKSLNLNTKVEVLDELKYCYVVKVGDVSGYMAKAQVSKNYIQYSGGGGGSADGGDITLSFGGVFTLSNVQQVGEVTGTAEVLADGAQVSLGYFDRGDMAPVVTEEGFAPDWDGYYTLYLDGMYAYLPQNLALMEGETPYEQWDGFAGYSAANYDSYLLQGEKKNVAVNTSVTVLWDGEDFYVVSIKDAVGYMAKSQVGTNRFATGGGGDSGGDWTPPAL